MRGIIDTGRPGPRMPSPDTTLMQAVLDFWNQAGADRWFNKDEAFDADFRQRFLDLHMAVAARRLDDWLESPDGALALLILTDQFPRNAFRGTAHMYATDPLARHFATHALAAGFMERIEPALRVFLCLPFSHSEDLADQDRGVELNLPLGGTPLQFAEHHRDIIRRFGRFPHRNQLLGRQSTPEEVEFLATGGFRG